MYYGDNNVIPVPANGLYVHSIIGSVVVTDNDGITYDFTLMEKDVLENNSVWYLTRIISANKADTVIFDYTNYGLSNPVHKPVIEQQYEWTEKIYVSSGSVLSSGEFKGPGGKVSKTFFPPRLNFIKYRGGKIDFIYTNTTTSRNLSEIKIYDNNNQLFKAVKLLKPRTDWLDGIEFRDNINVIQQTYAFEYNGIPATTGGIDYWGYYNGSPGGDKSYIPNFTFHYIDNGGAASHTINGMNRTPNLFYMQQGMLTKIVYPTKGYTVFEYEAHKTNNVIYGGLRIKEIRNYNPDNTLAERKWYKYGTGESGNGRAAYTSLYTDQLNYPADFCRETLLAENGIVVHYTGTLNPALGDRYYIKTFYPFPLPSYFASGSTVLYSEVVEYSGTGSVANGKTVYKYTDTPDEIRSTYRGATQPQRYKAWHWRNGLLLSKEVFNDSNQNVYSLYNYYSYLSTSETLNLGVTRYADIVDLPDPDYTLSHSAETIKNSMHVINQPPISSFAFLVNGSLFDYYNYYITTGIPVVTSSVEYRDGITTTTTYSNHNDIGLPRQIQVTNSNGDNLITKYKYPTDLSTTAPYNSMASYNIRTPVIYQEQYKGTAFLSKSVNEYKNWGNNLFEPEFLKFQPTANSTLENRITYHNRDSYGNPRYISKDGADNVVYLWSYNHQYPIAEIKGATYSEVTGKIAETTLNTIAAKNEPTTSDFTTITNLRTQLPNTQVTTYTYKPLVGMQTMTDPRGVVTKYDYDNFGRLNKVTQADNVIETYNYNYKN